MRRIERAAVLGGLEAAEAERQALDGDRGPARFAGGGDRLGEERPVQVLGLGEDAAGQPVAGVREERVGEALPALVGERVGIDRRAEQAEAELVAERVVAVLAVVEERDAVALLGEVGEAVGGDLEARDVPGGVAVRGAADHAVRAFEGGDVGADREREARLQQDAALVPVDVGGEVEPGGVRPEPVASARSSLSRNLRVDADRRAVRAALDDLDRARR